MEPLKKVALLSCRHGGTTQFIEALLIYILLHWVLGKTLREAGGEAIGGDGDGPSCS